MGVVSECCCKEVYYRYPIIIITFPYSSFMASVEECITERESRKFEEGLNTKVKLGMYKRFGKSVEFKKYLHGICDTGSRLLFKFRSGIYTRSE